MKQLTFRKYFFLPLAALLLLAIPACAQQTDTTNIVKNPGFENGATAWDIHPDTAVVVSDVAHSGKSSLYYSNTNAEKYELFTQNLDVKPNQRLLFSVWVKGKDISGKEGAGIYIESTDAAGNYAGGEYPTTFQGTYDWKQAKGEYIVPDKAAKTFVGLYLRKNITGTAWFDDVDVHVGIPKPFESFLEYPNYRGTIKQGDHTPWKFMVSIDALPDWKNGDIKIDNVLIDASGKVLLDNSFHTSNSDTSTHIMFPPPSNLPLGNYTLRQTVTDPNGWAALQKEYPIHVVREMPKIYIDAQGFTVKNGQRIFPLGIYLDGTKGIEDEEMQRISKAGFNTILAYGYGDGKDPQAYLDRAQKQNLNVVYSVKDMYAGLGEDDSDMLKKAAGYMKELRNSPALLAWYINDEYPPVYMMKLESMYNQVKTLDPDHPAYQVLYQIGVLQKYFDVTDILGADPYPVGNANLSQTSNDTRSVISSTQGDKGVWMVIQIMDHAVYNAGAKPHPPTLDEMRTQAYQSIINGTKGLFFYSYFDLFFTDAKRQADNVAFEKRWPDVAALATEIKALTPAILHGNKIPLALTGNSKVEAGAFQYKDEMLLMLANPYYEQEQITFVLPQGWKIKDANQGEVKSTFVDGKTTFTLPSVGSGVFRLVK